LKLNSGSQPLYKQNAESAASRGENIGQSEKPFDKVKSEKQQHDIERAEKKAERILNAGRSCRLDISNLDTATACYIIGIKNRYDKNLGDASCLFAEVEHEVMKASVAAGKLKSILFVICTYSLAPILFSTMFFVLYLYIIFVLEIAKYPPLLGIPLWAAISGGVGGCVGAIWAVSIDQRKYGVIPYDRQLWYASLPIVGLTSGYLVYILIDAGIVALGGTPTLLNVTGNVTAQRQPIEIIATESRVLYCFLAGFWTNKLFNALGNLLEKFLDKIKTRENN
jgi:hypothetical protein